jgi:anti-sigma factor RsiW
MVMRRSNSNSDEDQLARLADGTIGDGEREELERALARSPRLAALLAEQKRALSLTGAIDVEAPASLRQRIYAPRERRRRALRLPAPRTALVLVGAVVLLVLLAPRGHAPSVRSDVHLALAAAKLPPPTPSASDRTVLSAAVQGVSFPDWTGRGWTASGERGDTLDGRSVETVFYRSREYARLGYSIVAGSPLSVGAAQRTVESHGVVYSVIRSDGATVVTWQRDGHTCVLASVHATAPVLLALAGLA